MTTGSLHFKNMEKSRRQNQCLQSKPAAPKRPSDPAPKGSIALGVVLLVLGSGLLLHGARHLAGHIIRTDGAVRGDNTLRWASP